MALEVINSYLTQPAKNTKPQPKVFGATIGDDASLRSMLNEVYEKSQTECDTAVIFQHNADGSMQNDFRDDLISYLNDTSLINGKKIAERLQSVTTNRSGRGLLFLMSGSENRRKQIVIARFPADHGIVAKESDRGLNVEFIERVFMKKATTYKSALYVGTSLKADFWDGHAVDRQLNGDRELSAYWIGEFLMSDLKTTGPAGTQRLALALRNAIRSTADESIRKELTVAALSLRGLAGRRNSAAEFVSRLGLSDKAKTVFREAFPRHELFDEKFALDLEEYDRQTPFRAVELDSGGTLIAPLKEFNNIFQQQPLDKDRVRFTTEGKVVDEQVRKSP